MLSTSSNESFTIVAQPRHAARVYSAILFVRIACIACILVVSANARCSLQIPCINLLDDGLKAANRNSCARDGDIIERYFYKFQAGYDGGLFQF